MTTAHHNLYAHQQEKKSRDKNPSIYRTQCATMLGDLKGQIRRDSAESIHSSINIICVPRKDIRVEVIYEIRTVRVY